MRSLLHSGHDSVGYYENGEFFDGSNSTSWCKLSQHDRNWDWKSNHCRVEHPVWHMGQFLLVVAYFFGYLSVMYNIRRYKFVGLMRALIVLSSIFLLAWAADVAEATDQSVYYGLIMCFNFLHLLHILYYEKPITLNDYLHNLWHKMFNMNGYNLELLDFYNLMQEKAFLKTYKPHHTYIEEGDIPTQLSILLSGRMKIWKKDDFQRKGAYMAHKETHEVRQADSQMGEDAYCGMVYPYEFIDSYEWLMSQGVFKYEGTQGGAAASTMVSQVTIKVDDDKHCSSGRPGSTDYESNAGLDTNPLPMDKVVGDSTFFAGEYEPASLNAIKSGGGKLFEVTVEQFMDGDTPAFRTTERPKWTVPGYQYPEEAKAKYGADFENAKRPCLDVSVIECVVLTWKKEMLEAIFKEHPRLRVCIHSLVGKDIADKMLRITGHSTHEKSNIPDVDMVRKAHSQGRITMPADVRNAHQTRMEREVLPVPSNRSATILDDSYTLTGTDGKLLAMHNLSPVQKSIKDSLGAGPWCDLPDRELGNSPWKLAAQGEHGVHGHLLEAAKHSLQRARLRVTNSRLLGMNPGVLEALQPSSDISGQNMQLGNELLRYFEDTIPDLKKKDLHEILKWGRWRTFYRPGTVLVRQGEEAHYVGLVLQGRLALYTEDEITRSKSLVTYVDKFDLVGSEDFSSKFRTARRTIQMPRHVPVKGDADYESWSLLQAQSDEHTLEDKDHHEKAPQNIGTWADGVVRPKDQDYDNGTLMYRSMIVSKTLEDLKNDSDDSPLKDWDKKEVMSPKDERWKAYLHDRAAAHWVAVLKDGSVKSDGTSPASVEEELIRVQQAVHHAEYWQQHALLQSKCETQEQLAMDPAAKMTFDRMQPGRMCYYGTEDVEYLVDRLNDPQNEGSILVTTIPTVMYTWDIKDLKRLMLADPHVESTLSTLLRSDITFKLNNSSATALGTRLCGVPTQARGDQDIRMCSVDNA